MNSSSSILNQLRNKLAGRTSNNNNTNKKQHQNDNGEGGAIIFKPVAAIVIALCITPMLSIAVSAQQSSAFDASRGAINGALGGGGGSGDNNIVTAVPDVQQKQQQQEEDEEAAVQRRLQEQQQQQEQEQQKQEEAARQAEEAAAAKAEREAATREAQETREANNNATATAVAASAENNNVTAAEPEQQEQQPLPTEVRVQTTLAAQPTATALVQPSIIPVQSTMTTPSPEEEEDSSDDDNTDESETTQESGGEVQPVEPQTTTNEEITAEEESSGATNNNSAAAAPVQQEAESVVVDDNTITTATPETGIVTTQIPTDQQLAEAETGTSIEPEVPSSSTSLTGAYTSNQAGPDPRVYAPPSIQTQDYAIFADALRERGMNFVDKDMTFSIMPGTLDRDVVSIDGMPGVFDQPPVQLITDVVQRFGYQIVEYTFDTNGQLKATFVEAF